jgi:RND superfamily putative drug exporter
VIPAATAGSHATAYVGGFQAVTVDFTQVLQDALPWFLLIVVGLGFLALVVLFRSLLVPATGALTSLLSLGAALGVTVAVFQWGWFNSLVKLESTGPIFPFLPVMVFSILFGLSCDYQVFLVSRMHEEWMNTSDNRKAVRRGLAGSGRVVAIAAAIMTSVFGAFILGNDATIKLFGVALSTAVLFDAFVVRLILIPSLMTIFGTANWWLPGWLAGLLPHISVESEHDVEAGAAEIVDVPEPGEETEPAPV